VGVLLLKPRANKRHSDKAVVLAPTSREGGFRRRWSWACWLAKQGVTVMMVDNPFMGSRKPPDQIGSVMSHFTDFPLTCVASAEECRSAVQWLLSTGMKRVCVSGVSQGGYASIVATLRSDPEKVCAVAVVPPHGADPVIDGGVPGRMCAWDKLAEQFGSVDEARSKMKPIFDRTRIDSMEVRAGPSRVFVFGGERDRYVPKSSVQRIADHLGQACRMHWTGGGHVSAILERKLYANAILKALKICGDRWPARGNAAFARVES
jgi:pimeloyl-ACP methyl ester carboxylesterase